MGGIVTTKGFWWKPDTPDRKSFGILERNDPKAVLTIYDERHEGGPADIPSGATVHGTDEQGKPVTLLLSSRGSLSSPSGVITARVDPGYVLFGVHVAHKSSFKAKTLTLHLQHLYGWLGMSGFSRKVGVRSFKEMNISNIPPEEVVHRIDEETTVTFGMDTTYSPDLQSQSITEDSWISFTRESGFTFQDCWNLTNSIRLLLHLSILKKVYPVSMSLDGLVEGGSDGNSPTSGVKVWASHFHEQMTESPLDMLWIFRFDDVKAGFGDFFAKWLAYGERHSEALGCYSTTIYHQLPSPVENLCLTQALDAYHGARFSSHNKKDFTAKVRELCDLNKDALSGLVDDSDAFADAVVVTRNYYTHHNPKHLENVSMVKGQSGLVRLNEKIRILFQMCVLSDNGIPADRFHRLRRKMASEIIEF